MELSLQLFLQKLSLKSFSFSDEMFINMSLVSYQTAFVCIQLIVLFAALIDKAARGGGRPALGDGGPGRGQVVREDGGGGQARDCWYIGKGDRCTKGHGRQVDASYGDTQTQPQYTSGTGAQQQA
jgi:hypothetical protein